MKTHQSTDGEPTGADGATTSLGAARKPGVERTPIDVHHAPPRLTQGIAIGAVLSGALLTTPFATLAIPFGMAGVAIVVAALLATQSRGWLSVGAALVLGGALVTGAYGAVSPELMLVGVGATLLAWDVGQHGIVIGEQLGRRTRSTRNLLVHATSSAVVIGLVSAIAYLGYLLAGSGRQASAVAVVILGIIIMTWAFRS